MESILPENHLLLASSKRVLALIIEEIAVDHEDEKVSWRLLLQAEELHRSAISLSIQSFGELNVQTAKHYGNLGRLNQSMKRYGTAEEMHVKAIQIKEELLGNEDHEVALSVGHLASLYNYDVRDYTRAEHLYRRSIQIGVKLFGPGYSGLEYDYRGLIRIYQDNETGKTSWSTPTSYESGRIYRAYEIKRKEPSKYPFYLNLRQERVYPYPVYWMPYMKT
ncbi:Uncharacterized protein FKW44_023497 [Caligus rogercresseyi]|uniref:Amyloid protein-binding protein 2 n=1 Tax=Caligus rogercresseyi TaxID=217165 RepID=A0A7T8GPF2_CALRO|nr:Uncharacterized protein FKW44_023497 [Caligus rogercresseyi]